VDHEYECSSPATLEASNQQLDTTVLFGRTALIRPKRFLKEG
jgi:hypothetical protein